MKKILSIHCIYKARKTGKKTNRCQKINVPKLVNNWLQNGINHLTYLTYPKRLRVNPNHKQIGGYAKRYTPINRRES